MYISNNNTTIAWFNMFNLKKTIMFIKLVGVLYVIYMLYYYKIHR